MSVTQPLLAERYRLVRSLGQGGMGRVWLARDEVLHRDVAIKEVIPPQGLTPAEREEMRQRTLREARAAARLNHPSVVRVYDVVRTDVHPWIVMEYVPSRSLHEIISEDGVLPWQRVAQIGLQVLGALRAAHRAGVLHRDVKPSNVLLTDDGRVVLTDFGLATMPGEATVTRPGMVLGSPAYISPERAREGHAGPESDLWSLGATLYAAVEGNSPYQRSSAIATLTALVTEEPPPPKHAGALRPLLNGLLRKDPNTRIDAEEAERMLRRAAGGGLASRFWLVPKPRVGPTRSGNTPPMPTPMPPVSPGGVPGTRVTGRAAAGDALGRRDASGDDQAATPTAPSSPRSRVGGLGAAAAAGFAGMGAAVARARAASVARQNAANQDTADQDAAKPDAANQDAASDAPVSGGPVPGTSAVATGGSDAANRDGTRRPAGGEAAAPAGSYTAKPPANEGATRPAVEDAAQPTAEGAARPAAEESTSRADVADQAVSSAEGVRADRSAIDRAGSADSGDADVPAAEAAVDADPAKADPAKADPAKAASAPASAGDTAIDGEAVGSGADEAGTDPDDAADDAVAGTAGGTLTEEKGSPVPPSPRTGKIGSNGKRHKSGKSSGRGKPPRRFATDRPGATRPVGAEATAVLTSATDRDATTVIRQRAVGRTTKESPAVARPNGAESVQHPAPALGERVTRLGQNAGATLRRIPPSRLLVVALVLVAAIVVTVALLPGADSGKKAQSPTVPAPHASSAAPAAPAVPSNPAGKSSSPQEAGTPTATTPAPPALPQGWSMYTDPSGFSVARPDGWQQSQEGSIVYFREPGSGSRMLGIDQSNQPHMDPVADWTTQRNQRVPAGDFPGYQEIGIRAVNYWMACADWEFTYDRGGGRIHAVNRGFVTSDHQAYGIWWSTPDASWQENLTNWNAITSTFKPKP